MKLKRSCVSFALVLLLSFAFLAPCFISVTHATETVADTGDYVMSILPALDGWTLDRTEYFPVPCAEERTLTNGSNPRALTDSTGINFSFYTNYFKPTDYDRTVIYSFTPRIISGSGEVSASWMGGGPTCDVLWKSNDDSPSEDNVLEDGVFVSGTFRDAQSQGLTQHPYTFYLTVPATASFLFWDTSSAISWELLDVRTSSPCEWTMCCLGSYVVNTADRSVIGLLDSILSQLQDTDSSVENITSTLVIILNQLISLNTDTDTIISLLQSLEDLSNRELAQLVKISTSVDAIYYFLTEEMKSESEVVGQQAKDTMQQIDNTEQQIEYYYTGMSADYNALRLGDFGFSLVVRNGLEFVFEIFSNILHQFGETYELFFTFPLMLGMAFLVIGRIGKAGGKRGTGEKSRGGDDSA